MIVNIITMFTLLGGYQGIAFSSYIAISKKHDTNNNLLLILAVLTWSLLIFLFAIKQIGIYTRVSTSELLNIELLLTGVVYPLFFLHLKYEGKAQNKTLSTKEYWNIISVVLFSLCFFLSEKYFNIGAFLQQSEVYYILCLVVGLIYLLLSKKNIDSIEPPQGVSFFSKKNYIYYCFLFVQITSAAYVLCCFIDLPIQTISLQVYYFLHSATLYYILYLILEKKLEMSHIELQECEIIEKEVVCTQNEISEDLQKLIDYIEVEEKYIDPNLNIASVASIFNWNKGKVSKLVNDELGVSFIEYINSLRIDKIKALLKDEEYQHLKIEFLANEAGFNSKATFNRVFKSKEGMTPSEYKKQFLR